MSSLALPEAYEPEFPNLPSWTAEEWNTVVLHGVDLDFITTSPEGRDHLGRLLRNVHTIAASTAKESADNHIRGITSHMNSEIGRAYQNTEMLHGQVQELKHNTEMLQGQVQDLKSLVEMQRSLLESYKAQMDRLPADAGTSIRGLKVPEPPTFSGSDNKLTLNDWLNQISVYNTAYGIHVDHQRIVTGLTRLRSPATRYMGKYFDNIREGKDLGSWNSFIKELDAIYGKRDDKEGAKAELSALWKNDSLASKDFIKYAEQYRTLARIVEYEDKVLVDRLKDVIPQSLRNALVAYEVENKLPTKWDDYLELLLKAYKALHPDRAKSVIFGNSTGNGNGTGNSKQSDPNAMDIDVAKKVKGKQANSQEMKSKHCQICAGKGYKTRAKSHNTADCWEKPGNEGKRHTTPTNQPSTSSSTSGQANKARTPVKGQPAARKTFYNRLLQLLQEIDEDNSVTPAGNVEVNSATIEEIVEPEPAETEATAHIDEVQAGPSKPSGKGKKAIRQSQVDFLERL
ncbi:hypothetical protein C8J56DRAFT_792592 [Mycena floridula]|nr:hypothetical protein C8J56DRAFT_792592 [Mycena floridula]